MKSKAFVIVLMLIVISATAPAQDTTQKNNRPRIAVGLNYSPLLLYSFKNYEGQSEIVNDYNFQLGLSVFIYKYKKKNRFGATLGFLVSTKKFHSNHYRYFGSDLVLSQHNYTYLKIPFLFNYSYLIKPDILIGLETGFQLSPFIGKEFYFLYEDGTKKDKFPSELDFENSLDFVLSLNFEKTFKNGSWGLELKPFFFYDLKKADYYRFSFFNIGRLAGGVGFVVKKYL